MNRGSARLEVRPAPSAPASMRPRFMNRGSRPRNQATAGWSPRFNEAPIHESGKSRAPHLRQVRSAASMRPRFMNRGSAERSERC